MVATTQKKTSLLFVLFATKVRIDFTGRLEIEQLILHRPGKISIRF